jgi:hypothetical protein
MDTLFAVILSIEALRADKLSMDTLNAETLLDVILLIEALRADKLSMDVLNMDTLLAVILFIEALRADKLIMDTFSADKLNIDALIKDTLSADTFVNVFVGALNCIASPEKFVVVFCPPKLNVFALDPVSIFVVAILVSDVKIFTTSDVFVVHKLPSPFVSILDIVASYATRLLILVL